MYMYIYICMYAYIYTYMYVYTNIKYTAPPCLGPYTHPRKMRFPQSTHNTHISCVDAHENKTQVNNIKIIYYKLQ